jgi:hypothetical protein
MAFTFSSIATPCRPFTKERAARDPGGPRLDGAVGRGVSGGPILWGQTAGEGGAVPDAAGVEPDQVVALP